MAIANQRKKDKKFNAPTHSTSIPNEDDDISFIQTFMSKVKQTKFKCKHYGTLTSKPPTILPIVENGCMMTIFFHQPFEVCFRDNGTKLALGKDTYHLFVNQ